MKRFYLIICFLMSIIGSAWGQETYSIAFTQVDGEDAIVQSTENYFTLSEKRNRKGGTSCTYNGNTYGPGLKMESSTSIKFTTSYVADVTIVQSTSSDDPIKFQDKTLDLGSSTVNSEDGYREYVIKNVAQGTEYTIVRSSGQPIIFFVQVSPSTDNVTSFAVSDFNYTTGISARSGLNRTAGGFKFEFTSNNNNEFVKVNNSDRFFFRNGQSGTLAISTDDNNSDCNISKVVLHAVTPSDLSSLTGFSVTDADGNDLTYTTDATAGTITITSAVGTSKVNINTSDFSCAEKNGHLYINKIDVYTDKQVTFEKVTPQLAFASTDITTTVGGEVSNALTTTPNNFAVTYSITEDSNSIISEIAATGEVTLNTDATGTATITANFGGNDYYNAASSSYTLSVIEPKTTLNIVDFNYNAGTSVFNGLDRTGVDGFDVTFTGDASAPKFNSYELGLAIGNGGTMTVKAVDEGNTIRYIDFTKAESGNVSNSGIDTDVEGTWSEVDGAVRFTPTTPNQTIVFSGNGNDFAIAAMTICTSAVPANVGSKQTPTITLASDALTAEIGTNATVNSPAVTTVPQNFKVRYKIDEDNNNTGSTIDENTGVVTIGNTPGVITVQAYFSGKRFDGTNSNNNLFKAATPVSYTLTITELTQETTTFNVSDFNYASGNNSRNNNLDRSLRGFDFVFSGNDGLKCNNTNTLDFRTRNTTDNGSVAISTTNGANILSVSFTFNADMTGYYTATDADGNVLDSSVDGNVVTVTSAQGVSKIVFTKVNVTSTEKDDKEFKLSAISLTTDREMPAEKCQPVFAFEHASLPVAKTGEGVANALTTTPKSYPVTFNSSNTGVATIDAEGAVTPVAAGTTTITVSSTATDYFNAASASYELTVSDDESVAGETWNFTTWTAEDITTVDGDDDTWEYNNNGYYKNKTGEGTKIDFGLDVMEGLLFTTTGSDQIRIYPNSEGQTDGSIRLQSKNAKIYMPALEAGQTITLTMMTASESSARGMVFSGAGADKVQLIYGAETSKTMNVVTYRVTEDISAEELIMSASTGGLYLYSIKLGYSELYWTDGSNTVTDVAVTAAGETSYTLNSAADASYTITDANGNESTDVEVVNGKVKVNTFTLGKTHTITATVDGHSATLTLRMVNTATISYDVTEAEGTLGFSFVEPVLTKNPEGLNVVKWKSSNPEVATVVAETGEVTLVSAGEATITAYIEANNYYAYTDASYTLTVNEKPEMVEPWTLSLVVADGESVAVGSTGHKLTMTSDGTIKAGQVTTAIPGLTLSFGKTGDSDWTVAQDAEHFGELFVAGTDPVELQEDSYLPTGGAYLGLEPTVNGVLSLHTAYYGLQSVVVVDKETNTVVASRRIGSSTSHAYEDYEFTVPLQADRTYYVYNIGNGKEGNEHLRWGMPVNAITFTPVFLDRIGHVIVKNNEYNITGAQLADDIHDYPTFSNVHAAEGGSVNYSSDSDVIYLDEDGNLVIDGEGTATLQAHVSHTDANGAECNSVAQCTVTYAKSQLKFSGSTFDVATNLVSEFEEPTLVLPEVLKGVDAEYSISAGSIDSETGNVTKLEGTTATVTATIADNLYYNPTAKYIINILAAMVPFTVIEEITIPVGTRAFSLLRDNVYGGTTPAITLNDGTMYGDDKNLTWGSWIGSQDYQGSINKFFDHKNFTSTDVSVAKATGRMEIDALSEGTTTVTYTSRKYNGGAYAATPVVIKVNVVKDTDADYYEDVYNGSKATYRAWNFNQGFSAEELGRYNGSYTPLTNQSGEADNFITHLPDANAFWIYDEANNTLTSNTSITVTDDNKIDRESVAFIANEPMNLLTPAVTSYNCFGKSSGKMESAREVGKEDTYDYNDGDEDVLTFFTFRTATDEWEDSNGDGKIQLNTVSDITFNTTTTLTPITGVGSGENATPYKAISLGGKAAAIRVNDIKPGMWMAVIADNTVVPEEPNVGRVQLASDGAIEQAVGQTLYDSYKDSKDADLKKYATNRVTNIFPYLKSAKGATTAAIEQEGAYGVTNIMVGYPAGMGTMNIGGGEKSPKINNIQRTYGYATFVSPYNIDLTGQTALKAYICDYYGRDNNIVHLVQIKHIPARTPVVLKGYARDRYILFVSEGNQAVGHGLSDEVFAKNRLVGAVDEPITVNPTEVGLAPDGSVTTWHHFGLTKNKFLAYTKAGTLAQGRAYMRLTQEEYEDLYASEVSASATSADAMKVIFEDIDFDYSVGDNTTTGIENVEKNTRFEGDGYYYTLNGVRVNGMPTQKGIYIHNGRKIVVR